MRTASYHRVLIKMSGVALAGETGIGIDPPKVLSVAERIVDAHKLGTQLAIVVGAGNIWRGESGSAPGIERATADYMGMLATVMNALALQSAIEDFGVPTRVQSAIEMREVAENKPAHFGIPALRLVTEVNAGFQQLVHCD